MNHQRNKPCPCNSGKKYKKCCGSAETMPGKEAKETRLADEFDRQPEPTFLPDAKVTVTPPDERPIYVFSRALKRAVRTYTPDWFAGHQFFRMRGFFQ